MNEQWIEHLGLGAGIALLGSLALLFMVYRELAPIGGLSGRGRVLLTLGVGLGVLSFATKVLALAVMMAMPNATLVPLVALNKVSSPWSGTAPRHAEQHYAPLRTDYDWRPLPDLVVTAPSADAMAWVALGRQLFNDTALSLDGSVACVSCHEVNSGAGIDGRTTSQGIGGQTGGRNAPTVWNAAYQARLFWDGRASSLEEQAKGPPVNPIEMGLHSLDEVVARVEMDPGYRAAFASLLGVKRALDIDDVVAAIAAYERSLTTSDSPYDRYLRGDRGALDAAQTRGMKLFATVGCVICHHGPNFSSASVFDARMPYRLFPAFGNGYIDRYGLDRDRGRAGPTASRGLWRVPSLRNVALTAPYFHNGRVKELEEAVRIMATSQLRRRIVATAADKRAPFDLSEAEVEDLAAFLRALSSARLAAGSAAPPDGSGRVAVDTYARRRGT